MKELSFFYGKRVLITGHTGFKGSWLCRILLNAGAELTGFSLEPPTQPNLFTLAEVAAHMQSLTGDIRDVDALSKAYAQARPEVVLHLAAQPIVREGYRDPRTTFETNVMGTVNLLECVRQGDSARSVVNVTTDKVYQNREWCWGYRENEPLDGFDPYSNSKSCSELVTHSYRDSFFSGRDAPAVSTARAGNVIGGGDFAPDRIVPDCVRAVSIGKPITVRNPYSVRPYQHVLEPLAAYLLIARRQWEQRSLEGAYNVGPDDSDCVTTGELVDFFCQSWGEGASWVNVAQANAPHEATTLRLDCSKLKTALGWKPRWHVAQAIERTCEWTKHYLGGGRIADVMDAQIAAYFEEERV